VGLRLHERALVTGGHVCAVGARQWMVRWNVAMVVGSHIHFGCAGEDYRRFAVAVKAMDVGVVKVRRAGGWRGGVGVKKRSGGVAVSEAVGLGLGAEGAGRQACRWWWSWAATQKDVSDH
jgi:hypothetical protein